MAKKKKNKTEVKLNQLEVSILKCKVFLNELKRRQMLAGEPGMAWPSPPENREYALRFMTLKEYRALLKTMPISDKEVANTNWDSLANKLTRK